VYGRAGQGGVYPGHGREAYTGEAQGGQEMTSIRRPERPTYRGLFGPRYAGLRKEEGLWATLCRSEEGGGSLGHVMALGGGRRSLGHVMAPGGGRRSPGHVMTGPREEEGGLQATL